MSNSKSFYQMRWWAIFVMDFYYLSYLTLNTLWLYSALFLKWRLFLFLTAFALLPAVFCKKSPGFIRFINKYVNPPSFWNKFQRIYEEIPDSEGVLFAVGPHGVWARHFINNLNMGDDPLSNMTALVSRFILNMAVTSFTLRLWGIQSVDQKNMSRLMSQRKNIGLVPGGFEEGILATPDTYRLFIKNRKGFIKMALRFGYKIVPVLGLNEHKSYKTFSGLLAFRIWLGKFKVPAAIPYSKYGIVADHNQDVYTLVGKALVLPKIENPTKQQLDQWHLKYMNGVQELYEKYKHLNGNLPLQLY